MLSFNCPLTDEPPAVSADIAKGLAGDPLQLHYDPELIAAAAETARRQRNSRIYRLPFCHCLEAEAFGAVPVLSFDGGRIKDVPYSSIQEIPSRADLSNPRLSAMMEAMDMLKSNYPENTIAFDLMGPFTVLSELIPLSMLYRNARKEDFPELCSSISVELIKMAKMAFEHGAEILSVADNVATIDLTGASFFNSFYLPLFYRYLDGLKKTVPDALIFICGKLSQGLTDSELFTLSRIDFGEADPGKPRLYEDLLLEYMKNEEKEMVCQGCLNMLGARSNRLFTIKIN